MIDRHIQDCPCAIGSCHTVGGSDPYHDLPDSCREYVSGLRRCACGTLCLCDVLLEHEQRMLRDMPLTMFSKAFHDGQAVGFDKGMQAAREAVAGGFTTLVNDPFISPSSRNAVHDYLTGAIEEIDALKGEQA